MSSLPPDSEEDLEPPFPLGGVTLQPPFDGNGTLPNPVHPEAAFWGVGEGNLKPLTLVFLPWHELVKGDECVAFVDDMDNAAASDIVRDVNAKAYYLTIPDVPVGTVNIRGLVRRASSFQHSYSKIQTVEILPLPPGAYDQDQNIPYHSELKMRVENMPVGSVITKEIAAVGLWCLISKWLYARKNDRILLYCGGLLTTAVLSEADAKGPGPYRVFIPPSLLQKLPPSGTVLLQFTLRNVVGTPPGGFYKLSQSYKLSTETGAALWDSPYLLIDGSTADELNLSTDSQSLLEMEITPRRPPTLPKPPNQLTGIVRLIKDGISTIVRLPPVTDSGRGSSVKVKLAYSLFKNLGGGLCLLSFESHTPAGNVIATSGSFQFNVLGLPVWLPPLTIVDFIGGLLLSDKDAIVNIPGDYSPYGYTMLETFMVERLNGDVILSEPRPAGEPGGTRRVPMGMLQKLEGEHITLYYIIVDDNGARLVSEKLHVRVGTWVGMLPAPTAQNSEDGYIDRGKIKDSEFLVQFPYDSTVSGQRVNYVWSGKNAAASFRGTFPITDATEGQIFGSILFPLSTRLLDDNKDVECSLKYTVEGPAAGQVLYSQESLFYVGARPKLALANVLEAGDGQYELLPKNLNNGAVVVAEITPANPNYRVTVNWQGARNLSTMQTQAVWDPASHTFRARIDRSVIAKGVHKGGNIIFVTYTFALGRTTFTSEPKEFRLQPLQYLPTPTINDRGAGTTELRLYELTTKAITKIAQWNLINEGELVKTKYSGTFADGSEYSETFNEVVTKDHVLNGFTSATPVENILKLQDASRMDISATVDLSGTDNDSLAIALTTNTYVMRALAPIQPAPEFGDLAGRQITVDPLTHENQAYLGIRVAGMRTVQTFTPELLYPDGKAEQLLPQKGVTTGYLKCPIDNAALARMVNKDMTMRFYVVTSGAQKITSDAQEVKVLPIDGKDMPQVTLNKLPDNSPLDLNKLSDVLLDIAKWRLAFKGQRILITASAPGLETLTLRNYEPASETEATNGVKNIKLPATWLARVAPNTKIITSGKIIYDGSDLQERAIAFRSATYTVIGKLTLNTPVLNLNGLSVRANWGRTGWESVGNTWQLVTTGGSGTVTWVSSAPNLASVTPAGFVKGNGWGTATLTGTDAAGNKVTCQVNSSNVYTLVINEAQTNFNVALAWINSGHRGVGWDGIADLQRVYGARLPVARHYWFGTTLDPATAVFYHFQNAGVASGGRNDFLFGAWTLVRR